MTAILYDYLPPKKHFQNQTCLTLRSIMPLTFTITAVALCVLTAIAFLRLVIRGWRLRRREYTELDCYQPVPLQDEKHCVAIGDDASQSLIGSPLPPSIVNAVNIDRGDWVQRLTAHMYNVRHSGRYNVLTIHTKIDFHFAPKGVVERIPSFYTDTNKKAVIPFETIVFEQGDLVRLGDGGFVNWCFHGNFKRDDNVVKFNAL